MKNNIMEALKAIACSPWTLLKSLWKAINPEPTVPAGGWCMCCGAKGHASWNCPKDSVGIYKKGLGAAKVDREARKKAKKEKKEEKNAA